MGVVWADCGGKFAVDLWTKLLVVWSVGCREQDVLAVFAWQLISLASEPSVCMRSDVSAGAGFFLLGCTRNKTPFSSRCRANFAASERG